ncbi:hypothetical protein [Streptomyces sp. VNUA24]|uniref:hypothetical protein n=1 Tax=Streptomyces sp. VNUA24 TaxID=3031131 RepID=UPI0023B7C905|nr:hypothetical protein [Streptomyces sp. VNUA24]WEH12221.1 hypothetical protein PYR72_00275 [Streptomyces sp. VNUA24]
MFAPVEVHPGSVADGVGRTVFVADAVEDAVGAFVVRGGTVEVTGLDQGQAEIVRGDRLGLQSSSGQVAADLCLAHSHAAARSACVSPVSCMSALAAALTRSPDDSTMVFTPLLQVTGVSVRRCVRAVPGVS